MLRHAMPMHHQEQTLAAYVAQASADEESIAVVLVGSLAKGTEREDSDVDVYLIVTDEAFTRAHEREQLSFVDKGVATYDGGYVDIKVATLDYLVRAATEGDDPVRASFLGARVAWTRDPRVADLVAAIPVLPEEAWADRTASFIAQMRLYGGYFLGQGQKLGDEYLLRWAALHTVSSAGRALLARAHVLFPGNKYLSHLVAALPDLPRGYAQLAEELLVAPTAEIGSTFLALMEAHHDWPLAREQTLSRFVRENELAWLTRVPPPEFR